MDRTMKQVPDTHYVLIEKLKRKIKGFLRTAQQLIVITRNVITVCISF